jgi:hypothetical protein
MDYCITTFCYGEKYTPIAEKWLERITNKCKNINCSIFSKINIKLNYGFKYAWWDVIRLYNNLSIVSKTNKPVVHIDVDLIIEKDIKPLIDLPYDLIISKEIGEDEAYPKECSKILGFGVCSGFYIIKPSAQNFMIKLYDIMSNNSVNYSDQVNLMNYIVNNNYIIKDEEIKLDNVKYINKIIEIDDIKICVLDFNIIIRDPVSNIGQFGNHINIDNVGGTNNFLKYFDNNLENLPLTCRCGKKHLGDNTTFCKHIELRKNKNK